MKTVLPRFRKPAPFETSQARLAKFEKFKIMGNPQVDLALLYCMCFHEGQFRKGNKEPYYIHPIEVAQLLSKYGYTDEITQCIALLHDTVEDSPLKMDEINKRFGYEIANGVFILSRNKGKIIIGKKLSRNDYKMRLMFARNKIRRVKVADMIVNTRDLETLSARGRARKIKDAETFYIPLGREVCPGMVKELENNIRNYKRRQMSK